MIDLRCGNSLDILKTLPDKVVQCIVTSPPFYGLRDYGTAKWEGGNLECDHKTGRFERGGLSLKQASNNGSNGDEATKICPKCGAVRIDNQIGLESTPDEYVKNLCKVFDECWRVLRDDGLFWLNLGDSYSSFKDCKSVSDTLRVGGRSESANIISKGLSRTRDTKMLKANGFRDKSLMGIPWRVAFALQERGWILRSDIIWAKPNPMPESVKDRCTKSHEYIFMLSKQGRYYYDGEAIKEPSTTFATDKRTIEQLSRRISKRNNQVSPHKNMQEDGQQPNSFHVNRANGGVDVHYEKKNKRDVWTVTTKPYKGAHFATFPEDLIRPCILAGSRIDDVVLDPFCGAGTTGVVCKKLRRKFIGIDLNENYIEMSRRRIEDANEVPSISESE